ncbi:hypothetical protein D910_02526 [Dendroctonus ponderosae]|uniref:Dymeclin n=1 Tax=Dendroctonus ponderosae TaxID=77166 RepID=U4TU71_DENPD|nr:hypothetical protein D910_02526 [Dendroctonus ponderosae]
MQVMKCHESLITQNCWCITGLPSTILTGSAYFLVQIKSLYLTICKKANGDAPTLLLYLLLHRNASFKTFLLSRLDIQGLIIPILKTLYNAPNSHSHHIYMSIIILLILSEDDVFNKTIHQTTMAKKYQKLHRKLQNGKEIKLDETTIQINDSTELEQDVNVLEEVLRMVLEIINSCLTSQLTNNPNLIYTLLYNRQVFEAFRDNVVFQDIIYNIDIVIKYFSDLLNTKSNHQEVDASQVLQVIQQGGRQWPRDKLAKFPDLKFKYVEEEQPEEFFIPYYCDSFTANKTCSVAIRTVHSARIPIEKFGQSKNAFRLSASVHPVNQIWASQATCMNPGSSQESESGQASQEGFFLNPK